MKLESIQSGREEIARALQASRCRTLDLIDGIDRRVYCQQAHPNFSPIGWHLGHIAFTEAHWLLERSAKLAPIFPEYRQLFAADGLPKSERQNLPPLSEILEYLAVVREKVLIYLNTAAIEKQERLWRWSIQHETQHLETIVFVLQLHRWKKFSNPITKVEFPPQNDEMVEIPAGEFEMGSEAIDAQDNERQIHKLYLDTYRLDRYPVTCEQYREFIEAGGYQNPLWWSEAGWQWLLENPVNQPLYWSDSIEWNHYPVSGVSWYEADAYARFVKKRLPTEAEWEKAASWNPKIGHKQKYPWGETSPGLQTCNYDNSIGHATPVNAYPAGRSFYGCYDLLGNVWEWTNSWFSPYPGFESYPYRGYSQVYFDNSHRVLRGGSWATPPWGLRNSFRNWYHPWVREILAGFRCASGPV